MESPRGKIHVRAVAVATVAMVLSIFAFGMIADIAGSQGSTDHSDLEHHHGFTGPGNVADWPPRPTGAADLGSVLDNPELSEPIAAVFATPEPADDLLAAGGGGILAVDEADPAAEPAVDAADPEAPAADEANPAAEAAPAITDRAAEPVPTPEPVISDDPLAIALGADWVRVSYEDAKAGKDDITPAQETYFSRSNNQTVIVVQWPGSTEILTYPAEQIQPIVSPQEREEAVALGRQWLSEQGMTDVEALDGFAIRALDGGELYPVRMVYVTYAASWFDDPTMSALVDMTNLAVVEGGRL